MRAIRIPAILAAVALAGCSHIDGPGVTVSDRGTFIPAGRLSMDFPRGRTEAPSMPHRGHGLELGLSGTSGEGASSVSEPFVLGGQTFAPAELQHDFVWVFAEAAYRYRHFFGASRAFGFEALGGVAHAQMDLTVTSATQRSSEKFANFGPVGSFGLIWKVGPATSLQSRFSAFSLGSADNVTDAVRVDAYIARTLGSRAALRAGYSSWRVDVAAGLLSSGVEASTRVRFSGFALGLDVML